MAEKINPGSEEREENSEKFAPIPVFGSNVMTISDDVAKRLIVSSGEVDEERRKKNYDDYWIHKLACLDAEQTANANLDPEEILRLEQRIKSYTSGCSEYPIDYESLIDCYRFHKNDTLKCADEVQRFISCIDAHFYSAFRPSIHRPNQDEKSSY